MAVIKVDIPYTIKDGMEITFYAPCESSKASGLRIDCLDLNGLEESYFFTFCDALGHDISKINAFYGGVYVKVILDITNNKAFVQNELTNQYLEAKFAETARGGFTILEYDLPNTYTPSIEDITELLSEITSLDKYMIKIHCKNYTYASYLFINMTDEYDNMTRTLFHLGYIYIDDGFGFQQIKSHNLSLKPSAGEFSIVQNTSLALGDYSIALGKNTIAGWRGCYFKAIDPINKYIYILNPEVWDASKLEYVLEERKVAIMLKEGYNESDYYDPRCSSYAKFWEKGQNLSIYIQSHHHYCGVTFNSISGNRIKYDGDLPFNTIDVLSLEKPWHYIVANPDNPTKGDVLFTDINFATGDGNKALADNASTEGRGTVATTESSHVQGRFNEIDADGKFCHIVGGGSSEDDRKNIHTIDWHGNAQFAGDVYAGNEKLLSEKNKTFARIKTGDYAGTGHYKDVNNHTYYVHDVIIPLDDVDFRVETVQITGSNGSLATINFGGLYSVVGFSVYCGSSSCKWDRLRAKIENNTIILSSIYHSTDESVSQNHTKTLMNEQDITYHYTIIGLNK